METNLEKAKRLMKDNAAIIGIDLPEHGFIFKMLELAATLNEPSENVGQLAGGNYEQDDTTAMNCKHCGRSKWLHSTNILYPLSNTSGQLVEIANQYALSVMPTCSLEELSIISDAVIYGYGLRSENIGQPNEYLTEELRKILIMNGMEGMENISNAIQEIAKLLPSSPSGENGVNVELLETLKMAQWVIGKFRIKEDVETQPVWEMMDKAISNEKNK
jgi:hypothetical protein